MYGQLTYNQLKPRASKWQGILNALRSWMLCGGIVSVGLLAGMTL